MGRGYWLPPQHDKLTASDGFYVDSSAVYGSDISAGWDKLLDSVSKRLIFKEKTFNKFCNWKSCGLGQNYFVLLYNRHVEIIVEDADGYVAVAWNEQYTVVGFVSKVTRVSIDIDVEIKNEQDELCAYFRVELCALDLQSGKIRRVSTVGVDDSIQAENPETDLSFSKFNAENLPEVAQVKIKYTNIDYVGHTNNKEYIRFMLDTYSVRELEERPIKEMDIVYVNQTYENDILTVQKNSDKDRDIIAIKKDGNHVVKSEIVRSDSNTNSKDNLVS